MKRGIITHFFLVLRAWKYLLRRCGCWKKHTSIYFLRGFLVNLIQSKFFSLKYNSQTSNNLEMLCSYAYIKTTTTKIVKLKFKLVQWFWLGKNTQCRRNTLRVLVFCSNRDNRFVVLCLRLLSPEGKKKHLRAIQYVQIRKTWIKANLSGKLFYISTEKCFNSLTWIMFPITKVDFDELKWFIKYIDKIT